MYDFVRPMQFSCTGPRLRSPAIKAKEDANEKGRYELLSVDDLKCIGKFLQVPRLLKLQQTSNLISVIIAQSNVIRNE